MTDFSDFFPADLSNVDEMPILPAVNAPRKAKITMDTSHDIVDAIEIETAAAPTWSVIWLHGLGADGGDFAPIVPALGIPKDQAVRFLFPHAPYRRVTCNGGYEMRAWYDILAMYPDRREIDLPSLEAAIAGVHALIAREISRGVAVDRIFLAGFSQGGAVAYAAGLSHAQPLAGIIALSTYLPAVETLAQRHQPTSLTVPILVGHGDQDEVVSPALGQAAHDWLRAKGHDVTWRSFTMAHEVCISEVRWLGAWLRERMAAIAA